MLAVREGGEIFINGERVVFSSARSGTARSSATASVGSSVGSTVLTVTGQQANDAPNIESPFATIATIFGVLAAVALFM